MTECRFDGRVAVITGSGRGLGGGYALFLTSRGAKIVVNDNGSSLTGEGSDAGPAQLVVDDIRRGGGEAVACTKAVATPEGGKAIVDAALDSFGRRHPDPQRRQLRVPSAGIDHPRGLSQDCRHPSSRRVQRGTARLLAHARRGLRSCGADGSFGGIYTMPTVAGYAVSKSGMIGLNNIIAIEGADHGIKSNISLPGTTTRMFEGIDTSQFSPMGPEKVAPVVGWLAHESCSISGEMLISAAGRVARAYVTETEGAYEADWTIDKVGEQFDEVRDASRQWIFHPLVTASGSIWNAASRWRADPADPPGMQPSAA